MKIYCCICGRQVVSYPCQQNDKLITNGPVTYMGPTLGVACRFCSVDLDENGLFPEEQYEAYGMEG
jgi:hypothetical protein